jgi:RNA polymerase sigma factor (sigma-70 family)
MQMSLDDTSAFLSTRDLAKMGLKPDAKKVLLQAKKAGGISPREITGMLESSVIKDREKMSAAVKELKELLQTIDIKITLQVTHTHRHTHTIVTEAPAYPPVPNKNENAFLSDSLLKEHNLVPNAKDLLLAAQERGSITPQEIAALVPAEIAKDQEKLRPIMRWITQLLFALHIKISIKNIHIKSPDSRSPEVSYSVRPERVIGKGSGRPRKTESNVDIEIAEEPGEREMRNIEGTLEEDEALMPTFILKDVIDRPNPYYQAVRRHRFLTPDETVALSRRWHAAEDYEARNQIVVHNLRYVMKIAKRYVNRGLDFDDLVQEGNIGLMTAAERFEPSKGFRFLTYATWWIRQGIGRALQNHKSLIRMPVHAQEFRNRILKAACEVGEELEREPTIEEIAARSGESIENVKKAMHDFNIPVVSLEELAYSAGTKEHEPSTIGDIIPDEGVGTADTLVTAKEDLERCSERIRTLLAILKALPLSEKIKTAFKLYHGLDGHPEGRTFDEVREVMGGVTRQMIQVREVRVWKELEKYGLDMNAKKLRAELDRIHLLENLVAAEAILLTPDDSFILSEGESMVLREETSQDEVIPIITMEKN